MNYKNREKRYVTTKNIKGSRFSKHFFEDVEYYEKNRIPVYIAYASGSIRMTTIDGSPLAVSGREDWTHGNSGESNIISDQPLDILPASLFEL